MSRQRNRAGFECEFIENPPQWLQIDCPVCLFVLREPYQATCCGKSFCKECIECIKANNKPCPCCKQEEFSDFPNKGLEQPLYGFLVYCNNKEEGCKWTGELGQLDSHLNLNTSLNNQLEGCMFAKIKCLYCSEVYQRTEIVHHQNELCNKRPSTCEHCNSYESTYDDVIHNHWPVCGYPVQCPNKCGTFPQRQHLDNHVDTECPLTIVECDFHYAGCEIALPRKDLPAHLRDSLIIHFSILATSHKKQLQMLEKKEREIQQLKEDITSMKLKLAETEAHQMQLTTSVQQMSSHLGIFPVTFIMEKFEQYDFNDEWLSPPFYSHPYGYKLCITVAKVSLWLGKHLDSLSLNIYLMRGEFDDTLNWPFKATITLQLLSQHENAHYTDLITFSSKYGQRVTGTDKAKQGQECTDFISLSDLEPSYLISKCLHFRLLKVHVVSTMHAN